jgi:chemotaxis protein MotB
VKRRRHHDEEHENHERWLVSYADMITLLMVFFIVLYSSSMLNISKFQAFKNSAAEALGASVTPPAHPKASPGAAPSQSPSPTPTASHAPDGTTTDTAAVKTLYQQVRNAVHKSGLDGSIQVERDRRGVVMVLGDRVLFTSASADLTKAGDKLLDKVTPILVDQPMPIDVEGHTDSLPLHSARYATNWELSTARATNVLRYLVEKRKLNPLRMSASGYADTHPRARNTTAKGRAANRRVEIVLLAPQTATAASATPTPAASPTPSPGATSH